MKNNLLRSLVLTVALVVICGLGYPLLGALFSDVAFHSQATGSLTANGSTEIGQPWNDGTSINPLWFNGRPDADNPLELNGVGGESGAANLGPRSKVLAADVATLTAEWRKVGVLHPTPDLVTTSASGLDPDITPADALVQVPMIEKSRGLSAATLDALIRRCTQGSQYGFLTPQFINVLSLNEGLAKLAGLAQHSAAG